MNKPIKTAVVVLVTIVTLFASLLVFPWFQFMFAWDGGFVSVVNFVCTCIFMMIWAGVLLLSVGIKSKALFYVYFVYWILVTVFSVLFLLIYLFFGTPPVFVFFLIGAFVFPIMGIDYLFSSMGFPFADYLVLILPVVFFLVGVFVRGKYFKKSNGLGLEQTNNEV
ncbi:MAG: hypothetical protein FWB96_06280 [Defluviitaleaceae bacterium]|nr:hypothetical protein [Defluviitaleaceae bacterium]MCL2263593.1 hypothetical protein [Defluviitaleaceae bacterium]